MKNLKKFAIAIFVVAVFCFACPLAQAQDTMSIRVDGINDVDAPLIRDVIRGFMKATQGGSYRIVPHGNKEMSIRFWFGNWDKIGEADPSITQILKQSGKRAAVRTTVNVLGKIFGQGNVDNAIDWETRDGINRQIRSTPIVQYFRQNVGMTAENIDMVDSNGQVISITEGQGSFIFSVQDWGNDRFVTHLVDGGDLNLLGKDSRNNLKANVVIVDDKGNPTQFTKNIIPLDNRTTNTYRRSLVYSALLTFIQAAQPENLYRQ